MKGLKFSANAILWMIFASVLFGTGNAIVKAVSPRIPSIESVFFRSLLSLVFITIFIKYKKLKIIKNNKKITLFLILRGALGSVALICYFYAITKIQLGVAAMVNHTSPIFTAIFAFLILGERLKPSIVLLIILGFSGVVMIVSPDLSAINTNALVGLCSAFFASFAYITVRYLGQMVEPLIIIFYYAVIGTIVSLIIMGNSFVIPSTFELAGLVTLGLISTFAQLGLTLAYKNGKAGIVAPFMYTTVIVSYLYGIFVFDEIPDTSSTIGSIIILVSGVLIAYYSRKEKKLNPPPVQEADAV